MRVKDAIKSFSNLKWVASSLKAFLPSVLLIIVIESVSSLVSVAVAITSKNIIDHAVSNSLEKVTLYVVIFACIILYNIFSRAFLSVFSTKVHEFYTNTLRQRLFTGIIRSEWLQVSNFHSGDLLTRLTSDVSTVTNGTINIFSGVIAFCVQLIAAFITLAYYEPRLAILAFIMAPLTILMSRIFAGRMREQHLKIQETESTYRSNMQEFIQNITVLKTFNMEDKSLEKVDELQKERLSWVYKRSKTGAFANTIISLGYWTGYFLAFVWGALKLANKTGTFGTMTIFLQLVNQIQGPFIGLSHTVPQVISALASAGRLIELENLNKEIPGKSVNIPKTAGIRLKNLNFSYKKDEPVLNRVSMEVQPGEIVALIGSSGEGKTTILRLLLALLKPDNGEITCFNTTSQEYPISSSFRNWFSYVPQGNTLFSGTISDNLRSGFQEAKDEEMRTALEAACALEFVEKLPGGLNTVIGEKAHGLSEGQAQRIAIARALLRKAPIIILDEATSALNIEIEERLLKNIRSLNQNHTCIMITHRRTSLNICDKVYRLDEGKLTLETA